MLFIVLSIILTLALIGVIWWTRSASDNSDPEIVHSSRVIGKAAIIAYVVGILLLSLGTATHRLGTGQAALIYNFAGKLTGSRDHAGVFMTAPWSSVKKVNIQLQSETFLLCRPDDKKCSSQLGAAVTYDQQSIGATLQINYHVDPKDIVKLYQTVGSDWKEKLVDSRVLQDFKEISATFRTVAITQRREALRVGTRNRLQREFRPFSIDVSDFFIKNIGFSNSYNKAIEAKQKQVQAAAQAQAKVAQATAEANQVRERADGDAYALRVKGAALAAHPEVLQLQYINKLAPKVKLIVPQGSTLVTGVDNPAVAASAPTGGK